MLVTRFRLPRALVPFRSGRYRLLSGALISNLAGSGMWLVTAVWQLIEIKAGAGWVGAVATGSTGALALTALLGGVTADRASPRTVIAWVGAVKAVAALSVVLAGVGDALTPVQLVVVAAVLGGADGFFYPAYSALVPSVVDEDQLLAVNGVEAMLRPVVLQAAAPAAASAVMNLLSPTAAFAGIAVAFASMAALAIRIRQPSILHRSRQRGPTVRSTVRELREGFRYVADTRWLVLTLTLAITITIAYAGPIQVLLPLVIAGRTDSGPDDLAFALAGYGLGGVLGALVMSSMKFPRRYLTIMIITWGAACAPLAIVGMTQALWLIALALLLCGAFGSTANTLWGTLLQRRVPRNMLGRVASLDFFVSLSAAPLSAALVLPAADRWSFQAVYLVAGLLPLAVATLALTLGGLRRDETAHTLHK